MVNIGIPKGQLEAVVIGGKYLTIKAFFVIFNLNADFLLYHAKRA